MSEPPASKSVESAGGESTGSEPAASAWVACPSCGWLLYERRLGRDLMVCSECDHHLRLRATDRIAQLVDQDSFEELTLPELPGDPLGFADRRAYVDRLQDARRQSGASEALVAGTAELAGHPLVLLVMDFAFLGGSMGVEVGRRVAHGVQVAIERRLPVVAVCASGGARMQEGVLALAQMTRTSQAFGRLNQSGLASVCVLTDPTYGGVSASFASLGGIVIAEAGAHIGFAGPRVVEQTVREKLPEGFQTAEFLLAHGLVDRVEHRADLRGVLARILELHAAPTTGRPPEVRPPTPLRPGGPDPDAWTVVQAARDVQRPTTRDYLATAFDDFVELHGDRARADDPALIGGLASIGGRTVVVLGHQKGHELKDLVAATFGMPHPEGYRKALRLLGYAERFNLPVVTLVDTPGAHPGPAAEESGQSIAIAEMIQRIALLRVPVVSVVTGEGGSGGALALCSSDRLLMLERSYLSVISPEGCAAILWRDATAAPAAARALRLLPGQLLELGLATGVVPEPPGGAAADPTAAARALRAALLTELADLWDVPAERLVADRVARFSALDHATVGQG